MYFAGVCRVLSESLSILLYNHVIIWLYHIMLLFGISIIGPLHALVSLCSGVMWVFILFLAAALKNAHCDFLLTEALSSTQVFLWILKTLFLSRFLLFANSVFINVEASLQCALGGNFGGSAYGLFKAGQICYRAAGVDGIKSQWLCKKSATFCTLYCLEMRIPVERKMWLGMRCKNKNTCPWLPRKKCL